MPRGEAQQEVSISTFEREAVKKGCDLLRIQNTLLQVGPAVFYGGLSTLLAVVLLAASDYYPFVVFFKVFLLVVVFGLFHGLVFLPVVLALVGPSHLADDPEPDHINKIELEKLQSSDNL